MPERPASAAVLDAGLRWLYETVQPDDAHQQHHGTTIGLPETNRTYGFCPSGALGLPVVSVNVAKPELRAYQPPLNPIEPDELPALAAELERRGFEVRETWNGHPGITGSVGLVQPAHPTLVAAVQRYHRGCTVHPHRSVFCDCEAWNAGFTRIVRPAVKTATDPIADDETPWRSADYVEPGDRVAEWAEMARSLARDGFGPEEIAANLCVDEPTVAQLLQHAGGQLVTGPDAVEAQPAGLPKVLDDIRAERARQDQLWGEQNHPDGTGHPGSDRHADFWRQRCKEAFEDGEGTWGHVLLEEVFEAVAEYDPDRLRAELVQVAAVAANWIEAIDRRAAQGCPKHGADCEPDDHMEPPTVHGEVV